MKWSIRKATRKGESVTHTEIVSDCGGFVAEVGPWEQEKHAKIISSAPRMLKLLRGIRASTGQITDVDWEELLAILGANP